MKEGMKNLTAIQVASVRIISSGLVLLPVAYRSFVKVQGAKIPVIFLSGLLGSLLPAYLFCIAEQTVGSALAGTLNSLTPIFVIIIGSVLFAVKTSKERIIGISIAFGGTILLCISQPGTEAYSNLNGVIMIVLATIMYGMNVNIVQRYLQYLNPVNIASIAFCLNGIPALIILLISGYFKQDIMQTGILMSTFYSLLLGIIGTALATILFYTLIRRSGAVFSSMVTYLIPVVANIWGLIYGENIGWLQVISLLVILIGVFVASQWTYFKKVRV